MADHQINNFWDEELSRPGHNAILTRSSGDNYKSITVGCFGGAGHPYLVEEGEADDDCGWSGPHIRPGRWQEKHVREAFERHIAHMTTSGPIDHGAEDNYPDVCQCSWCRLKLRPEATGSPPRTEG